MGCGRITDGVGGGWGTRAMTLLLTAKWRDERWRFGPLALPRSTFWWLMMKNNRNMDSHRVFRNLVLIKPFMKQSISIVGERIRIVGCVILFVWVTRMRFRFRLIACVASTVRVKSFSCNYLGRCAQRIRSRMLFCFPTDSRAIIFYIPDLETNKMFGCYCFSK